jgi:hypothetical protein
MSIFDDVRIAGATYRLTEEALYAEVHGEIESGVRRDGIWAKALADSNMDQLKAQALYINRRVQALKDEVTVFIASLKVDAAGRTEESATSKKVVHKSLRLSDDPAKDPNHWMHRWGPWFSLLTAVLIVLKFCSEH